jgi:hypothetical protein
LINSKKLLKFSEKLQNIDTILEYLNSGQTSVLTVSGTGTDAKLVLSVSSSEKAVCDLSNQIAKALLSYRDNIERSIRGAVR